MPGSISVVNAMASQFDVDAASASTSGLPAVIIIVGILALIIIGMVAVVRFLRRKAKGE